MRRKGKEREEIHGEMAELAPMKGL